MDALVTDWRGKLVRWSFLSADYRRPFTHFPASWPTLEDCVISYERQTEQAYKVILNDGGAGSSDAMAAHAEWMTARTQRATMDARAAALSWADDVLDDSIIGALL